MTENEMLQEELVALRASLQTRENAWQLLFGNSFHEEQGPSLEQTKEAAVLAREMVAGSTIIKRGASLRASYVWANTLPLPEVDPQKKGPRNRYERFVSNPVNKRTLLSDKAKTTLELSLATDGCVLFLGDNSTKSLRAIPVTEITSVMANPDFEDEVWAYRREWRSSVNGKAVDRKVWYYTDVAPADARKKTVKVGNENQEADQTKTILDMWVNRQVGWTFGVGDTIPALPWARIYTELLHTGKIVNDALASLIAKAKVGNKKGSDKAGLNIGKAGAGSVTTYGQDNEVDVFSTAGKTYDFDGIRPVAAMVAAGLEVSLVHLLSDPGAAGSSYGSAATLDLPTKRAMVARQNEWVEFLERVFEWGVGEKESPLIKFPPLEEPDMYRHAQAITLAWHEGVLHPQEVRDSFVDALGIPVTEDTYPEGIMVPNNEFSLARRDVDRDSKGASVASPDQGQSNGVGDADKQLGHDIEIPAE